MHGGRVQRGFCAPRQEVCAGPTGVSPHAAANLQLLPTGPVDPSCLLAPAGALVASRLQPQLQQVCWLRCSGNMSTSQLRSSGTAWSACCEGTQASGPCCCRLSCQRSLFVSQRTCRKRVLNVRSFLCWHQDLALSRTPRCAAPSPAVMVARGSRRLVGPVEQARCTRNASVTADSSHHHSRATATLASCPG